MTLPARTVRFKRLPGPGMALDHSGQDCLPHRVDCLEATRRVTAPLESSCLRRPVKQRDMPRVSDSAALVVNEAVEIVRTPSCDHPADWKPRRGDQVGGLKRGSGL